MLVAAFSNYPDDPPMASSNSVMLPSSSKEAQEALEIAAFLIQFAGKYSCIAFCSNALQYPPFLVCQAVNFICLVSSLAGLTDEEQARERRARRLSPSPCALPRTVFPIPWVALDAP